jgi:SynChlorMet cassette radical SAM/SPASM protein ScmE
MVRTLSAPITVSLNVTNRCNLRCRHCFLACGEVCYEELGTNGWLSLIHQLADCKVFKIFVNGGEPLVREDIFVLLEELTRHPFAVTMFTNGTLITEETADRLANYKLSSVSVSLDGSKPETHDALRGEGTFNRTLTGIQRLIQRGLTVGISCVVTQLNLGDLADTVKLAQETGAIGISFQNLRTLGVASDGALSLSRSEDRRVAETLLALEKAHGSFVSSSHADRAKIYESEPPAAAEAKHLASCSAAKSSCSIRPDGTLIPCNYLWDVTCGIVREQAFIDIWRHSAGLRWFRALSELTVDDVPACRDCKYKSVCDAGCRAIAHTVCGDSLARDPFCWYNGRG